MLMIITSLAMLATIIVVHELGHFVAARIFGIGVITVSLGFGPRLWAKRFGNTVYCISAIRWAAMFVQ